MRIKLAKLYVMTSMLVLAGCFGGGSEIPQDKFYRLAEINTQQINKMTSPYTVVSVATLKSDSLHRERAILYSEAETPLIIQRYHYHHWTQTPNQLVQEALIDYLRASQFSSQVIRYGEQAKVDANITGYIKNFERVISNGEIKVRVHLELQFETYGKQRKFVQRDYMLEEVTANDSMHATVKAISNALYKIYGRFLAELTQT